MNREYHKWYSSALGREMELLVFGHGGTPFIVFPTSMGRFFDYENRGMIGAIGDKYENGAIQAFCVDSVDTESWYNKASHPRDRVLRHMQYERYLLDEVVPFVRKRNSGSLGATGCSFGGYHAANLAFRHPEIVSHCVSMGGAFDIRQFLNGYYDDNCYFNCPVDFLSNLSGSSILEGYRRMRIVLATGETDICLDENRKLSAILGQKDIPHWLDVWGDGTGHDWPWWQAMARKFL
jgi:esterase/lipase superfamily enzyme